MILCWWCTRPLVGPGGSPKRTPLYFREVEIQPGQKVKVHVACEKNAAASTKKVTAQVREEPPEYPEFGYINQDG